MWFRSIFDALSARSSGTPAPRRRPAPRVPPRLEILEDRTLLSTYTVNTLADTGAGSGQTGDLRYCVTNATSGSDTIDFAAGLSGTILLQNALPTLNASVTVQGPGADQLTVAGGTAGGYKTNMLIVGSGATVPISGLTLAFGTSAITNYGSVIVNNSNLPGSYVALNNYGSATVNNSALNGNNSDQYDSSAIVNYAGGTLTVNNSTLDGNATGVSYGSAILNDQGGTLTVSNSTFEGNFTQDGGAIANFGSAAISYSSFDQNDSYFGGAAIYNIGTATISYSTLSGNSVDDPYFDIIGYSFGGAVYNAGNLTVNNSTLSGNKAVGKTAYITGSSSSQYFAAEYGTGGGIYMNGGTLSINSSTLEGNQAVGGSDAVGFDSAGNGEGGGLYIAGGTVSIDNSTLAGNQVIGGTGSFGASSGFGYGGSIYNAAGPDALQMHDTILANDTADVGPDLNGSVTSLGHNLIGNSTGGSGFVASDLLNVNPQLGPLQNNGGPTQTMALLAGSPAIDAGDNTNAPAYDQRGPGFARIVNGTIDIGAYEVQSNSNQASSLTVSGFPSVITAGNAGSFTVTAKYANGNIATSYTGTVQFTSSDGQAVLPANYTFTAADAGVHTFSAILKTAGTQSLTAKDNFGLTGSEGSITVNPAAASSLTLSGFPASITAGTPGAFTVTAIDPYGNTATGYSGIVHFTSSDSKAVLPGNATLTNGVGQFSATLKTAGTQSLTVTDTAAPSPTSTEGGITVKPAAASKFILSAPSKVNPGVPFSLTVTVEDAYGNVVVGYSGTIHFGSTDSRAKLPADYTFTASDNGAHTFTGLVLRKAGNQKITITDTHNSSITGSALVEVL